MLDLPLKPDFRWMLQSIHRSLAFGLGSGLSPVAPGTAGTLWGWAAFLIAEQFISNAVLLWVIVIGLIAGCWICGQVSEELGKQDFGGIVWDEIMAFWLVLLLITPAVWWVQILAFALFRFFDAVKPGLIGTIDRHFKNPDQSNTPSTTKQIWWRGFGIMIDDLAAAAFTLLTIALVQFIFIQVG